MDIPYIDLIAQNAPDHAWNCSCSLCKAYWTAHADHKLAHDHLREDYPEEE